MPKYTYAAENADGVIVKGTLSADTLNEARRDLDIMNLEVRELAQKRQLGAIEITKTKIKRAELMNISRQLAAFIRAGIPILDAIAELRDEADSRGVKRVMTQIGNELRDGSTLSEAVDQHPKDFPTFYRGILKSAELTGQLDTTLDQLSVYIERDLEARRKIKSAMTYPVIIAIMAVLTVVVIVTLVLPQFQILFSSLGADLPAPTLALIAISEFFQDWGWLVGLCCIGLVILYFIVTRFRAGRKLRDRVLLKIPVLGVTIKFSIIERFTRILASMVAAGVDMPEAMRVATNSLNNLVYEDALNRARLDMLSGGGLATPIAETRLFPGMASQMIRVGETTGTLDIQLSVAATYYERELDYKTKKLATIIEPVVLIVMGGIVGFVAIALVSAMYGIFRSANLSG